jgi:glycosyltransferase involved in cell wall biosynthesis
VSYAVITPLRNEAENLPRLASAVLAQTVLPAAWMIVDDGSSDGTLEIAQELARAHGWIHVEKSPGATERDGPLGAGRQSGRDIVAFHTGLAGLGNPPAEFVVKLDADVSLEPDYFQRVLGEFARDPLLAIAGGTCWERDRDGVWRAVRVRSSHVRGAARVWRWQYMRDLLPLEERLGWDVVDEVQARLNGWTARSLADVPFFHHRGVGSRDGSRREWDAQGRLAYYLGYRFPYLVGRAVRQARQDRAAFYLVTGYVLARVRREPRHPDARIRRAVREQQRLRHLPPRLRGGTARVAG